MADSPIRVLLAKMGLDCHDTGIVTVAAALRDAGMEVVYLGLHNTAEKVFRAAEQEDAEVLGLSFLSGQHLPQTRKLTALMKERGLDALLVEGGVIPRDDIPRLKEMGVNEVFAPGTMMRDIVSYIHEHALRKRERESGPT
jgi:methylmalonyl-CoA mutase C-terminal domain/subunit